MGWVDSLSAAQTGLVVAFGSGLLVGVERERRKGAGPERQPAGLRTFVVAALAGAVGQVVSPIAAGVALAAVAALAALSYWRSSSDDPGLTTELALIAITLIGMLAVSQPALAAALAVGLAGVLTLKTRLHRFATEWLSEAELHDGLLLAALALVLLPLLPSEPIEWLGQLSPQRVLMLVVVILAMQAMSHLGQRLLGARSGVALSGLIGGFVSSTATISALGAQIRSEKLPLKVGLCGAILSTAATWFEAMLLALVLSPDRLGVVASTMTIGAAVPLLSGLILWRKQPPGSTAAQGLTVDGGPVLRPIEALKVSAMLVAGALLVQWAHANFPDAGLQLAVGVAAIADAHAPMAALLSMHRADGITEVELVQGLILAIGVNSITRTSAAWLAGGTRFAMGLALPFVLSLVAAAGWMLLAP